MELIHLLCMAVVLMQVIQVWLSELKANYISLKVKMDGIGPIAVSKKLFMLNGSNGQKTLTSTFVTCHSMLKLKPNSTRLQLLLSSTNLKVFPMDITTSSSVGLIH